MCTLISIRHHPSSTLLVLTVSFSVAKTYQRSPGLCFHHSVHLVFSPAAATERPCLPSGCGGKGRQKPQCFWVFLIKLFLWVPGSKVQRQRDRAEATANLWPLWLSPVQQWTLKPVMGWPRLRPETHDTVSAPQWPLCVSCSQASFASAAQSSAPNCMRLNLQSHLMIQEDHFIAFSTVLN